MRGEGGILDSELIPRRGNCCNRFINIFAISLRNYSKFFNIGNITNIEE